METHIRDRGRLSDEYFVDAPAHFEINRPEFAEHEHGLRLLNDALEAQAKRIAYTLHSEAGQLLASAHLALAALAVNQAPGLAHDITKVRSLLNKVEERLRHISHELRPSILDDLGLVPALDFLAESAAVRWGLSVSVDAKGMHARLNSLVETTLYRVAQEGLSNVARHADATRVTITLTSNAKRVRCVVRDNGVGPRAAAAGVRKERGLGLIEMQERLAALGGVFRFGPGPRRGAELAVDIPLES